ncbi:uncharacterized protein CLUP02_08356 [Colletotrichum lupini]|uniref:Uncharacterized protein n=1 Tax=Colletotrichum lupini TaxID=145971 RepID=A0A9Q8WGX9_9PEZI|nr:uncharacterized protein CLUP02_08356 [Colletotrichum lupini]UQC82866.1 hypothetical protein CLUP02_08356 [Colletotrichum lupini]
MSSERIGGRWAGRRVSTTSKPKLESDEEGNEVSIHRIIKHGRYIEGPVSSCGQRQTGDLTKDAAGANGRRGRCHGMEDEDRMDEIDGVIECIGSEERRRSRSMVKVGRGVVGEKEERLSWDWSRHQTSLDIEPGGSTGESGLGILEQNEGKRGAKLRGYDFVSAVRQSPQSKSRSQVPSRPVQSSPVSSFPISRSGPVRSGTVHIAAPSVKYLTFWLGLSLLLAGMEWLGTWTPWASRTTLQEQPTVVVTGAPSSAGSNFPWVTVRDELCQLRFLILGGSCLIAFASGHLVLQLRHVSPQVEGPHRGHPPPPFRAIARQVASSPQNKALPHSWDLTAPSGLGRVEGSGTCLPAGPAHPVWLPILLGYLHVAGAFALRLDKTLGPMFFEVDMMTTIYANILESFVGFLGGAMRSGTTATHRGPSRSCLRNLGATRRRRRRRRCAHNEGATLYPYGKASPSSVCGKAVKVKICWAGWSDPSNLVKWLFADMMASSPSRNYLGLPSPVLLSLSNSPSRSLNLWQGILLNPVLWDRGKRGTEYGFKGLTDIHSLSHMNMHSFRTDDEPALLLVQGTYVASCVPRTESDLTLPHLITWTYSHPFTNSNLTLTPRVGSPQGDPNLYKRETDGPVKLAQTGPFPASKQDTKTLPFPRSFLAPSASNSYGAEPVTFTSPNYNEHEDLLIIDIAAQCARHCPVLPGHLTKYEKLYVSLSLSPHIKFVGSMGQFGASQQEKSAIPPYPQPKPAPGQGLSHQTEGLDVLLGIAWPILAQRKAAVLGMDRDGPSPRGGPAFNSPVSKLNRLKDTWTHEPRPFCATEAASSGMDAGCVLAPIHPSPTIEIVLPPWYGIPQLRKKNRLMSSHFQRDGHREREIERSQPKARYLLYGAKTTNPS